MGKVGSEAAEVVEKNVVKELSEAEAKQMTKAAKEAIEKGTAREASETTLKETNEKLNDILAGMSSKKLLRLWKTNVKEGKFNCANCAMAVDNTLAGRPASALPWT